MPPRLELSAVIWTTRLRLAPKLKSFVESRAAHGALVPSDGSDQQTSGTGQAPHDSFACASEDEQITIATSRIPRVRFAVRTLLNRALGSALR